MKETLAGTLLGLALLAGLFAAAWFSPHAREPSLAASAPPSDFAGSRRIGAWTLVCAPAPAKPASKPTPIPFSLSPHPPVPVSAARSLGRCRASLFLANKTNPRQIMFAANFRLIGQAHALTVILRFPPSGQKGALAVIRVGNKAIRVPVLTCAPKICMAAGKLDPAAESLLYQSQNAVFVFPPGAEKKSQVILPMPLSGLKQAISDMRQAEGAGD